MRVGAVDCGTNSIRLLVNEVSDSGVSEELVREMKIVRLGEGVDASGRLSTAALNRVKNGLGHYVDTMASLGVERVRMVATSATRDASNAEEFLSLTSELLGRIVEGAHAEVISGTEEARLTFLGAVADLDAESGPFCVTDLGGGSTEVVVGELIESGFRLHGAHSMDIGCVRLTERCLQSDPPTPAEITAARRDIDSAVKTTSKRVPLALTRRWIGVAGTFTTLAALGLKLPNYDSKRIHGATLSIAELVSVCERLVELSAAQRRELGPMHEGRADVIGGGALVTMALARLLQRSASIDSITISEKDILDGIAASLVAH